MFRFDFRTYWLVTVSGFQGSSSAGKRTVFPGVFPAVFVPPVSGGEELLYAFLVAVSTTSFNEFRTTLRAVLFP